MFIELLRNAALVPLILLVPLSLPTTALADSWECESDNHGLPQSLTLELTAGKPSAISYTSMAPAPDGTKYSCSFEATRSDGRSEWSWEGATTRIKLNDYADPTDVIELVHDNKRYRVIIKASYQNCGHSTPFANELSISKGKKQCHDIQMRD